MGKPSTLLFAALGAAVVAGTATYRTRRRRRPTHANLASYLVDHLSGADAALAVVTRLSGSQRYHTDGVLFERLREEFIEERRVVRSVLAQLGQSSRSVKRAAGQATGAVLQAAASDEPGSLGYFRTLESLMVGVQGKRCLWRALRAADPDVEECDQFVALEQRALDQWRQLEDARQRQVVAVFGGSD